LLILEVIEKGPMIVKKYHEKKQKNMAFLSQKVRQISNKSTIATKQRTKGYRPLQNPTLGVLLVGEGDILGWETWLWSTKAKV
jgi:hypothetical protein